VSQYLKELNENQRLAVEQTNGPALVIAGAGSGKTRVLTYKIAHLLSTGVPAYTVLALTFTNKAAKEMKGRISELIGEHIARDLWMGTFHSIFARILRKEAAILGFPPTFTIYDTLDSKSLLKTIIKDLKLDDQAYKINDVYGRISHAKNNLITPAMYENNLQLRTFDNSSRKPEIYRIYELYSQRCFRSGSMDFDDLLLYTNILFRDHKEVLEKYQNKFNFILVDEYQDTNFSQYVIVNKLAAKHKNLCVVGDDAQSIYSFRGAKIENILNFKNDYPDYKLYKLEQNYRSTQTIVDAANSIISKNKRQIQKKVFSENEVGSHIKVIESQSDIDEGYIIANFITEGRLREHFDYKDFAILYRTNAQSRIFEEALRKKNIPYRILGGLSFYQRKEIKDVLSYCRLVINRKDDEALKRVINYPKRGIGDATIDKIETLANQYKISMWEVIGNLPITESGISSGTINKIKLFTKLIEDFSTKLETTDAYQMVSEIISKTGILKDLYDEKTPESISRTENIQELLNGIREFVERNDVDKSELTLDRYLQDVSLLTNDDKDKEDDNNKVILMTIHSAKGLEFENVCIVGVEEELFPSAMTGISMEELEEERRLFYVAVTRAKKNLVISFAKQRYRWGNLNFCVPSRFIKDIDPVFIDWNNRPNSQGLGKDTNNGFEFDDDDSETEFTSDKKKESFNPNKIYEQNKLNKLNKLNQQNINPVIQFNPKPTPVQPKIKVTDNPKQDKKLIKLNNAESKNQGIPQLSGLIIGARVEHGKFGIGTVIELDGMPPNTKATIRFDSCGQKTILLKFAQLKIIP
jgi:DNA helicase-2/ATP-dependent DNA helicase PcrA